MKLLEHFRAMQAKAAQYLSPQEYEDQNGGLYGDTNARKLAFVSDILQMLDGPEQRVAQGEAEVVAEQGHPTMDAYMGACRALHWATALLRHHGLEPINLSAMQDPPHYPPEDYDFGPSIRTEREEASEWRMDIRRQVEQAETVTKDLQKQVRALQNELDQAKADNNELRSRLMSSELAYASLRGYTDRMMDEQPPVMVPQRREPALSRMPDGSFGTQSPDWRQDGSGRAVNHWYHRP